MIFIRCLIVFFALSLFQSKAGTQEGYIDWINVRASDGLIFFALKDGIKHNSPTCAANNYWMIRDENSEAGKKQFALLLTAQAAGKKITVVGMNSCQRWGDGEDVDWIRLAN
ncbi:MAG: hypothetical protein ACK4GU_11540 [Alishewanella aestuarii]|jgi:hypothetical protein